MSKQITYMWINVKSFKNIETEKRKGIKYRMNKQIIKVNKLIDKSTTK